MLESIAVCDLQCMACVVCIKQETHVRTCQVSTHNMPWPCLRTYQQCSVLQSIVVYAVRQPRHLPHMLFCMPLPFTSQCHRSGCCLIAVLSTITVTVMDVVVQMYGPDVPPLTIGKQNLVMYVLRQLEKHFFVVNQFFRLKDCSHNIDEQSASISLTVVTHTGITDVGLDTVSSNLSPTLSRCRRRCYSALRLLRPYLQSKLLCA